MKKVWISLSAILGFFLLLILAPPLIMGICLQKHYPELIKNFNSPHVSFKLVNFNRGWFHSTAQIQVTFHSAETALSGESPVLAKLNLSQEIQHGPVIIQKSMDGAHHLILARAVMQNRSLADNLNFKADTLWALNNRIDTDLIVEKLLLGNDRQRMEINHLTGSIHFDPAEKRFQSQLTLANGVLYENNPEKVDSNNMIDLVKVLELDDFILGLNIKKNQDLWYGQRHFSAGKITIFPYSGSDVLTVDNLVADLNQNKHDDLTDFELLSQIEQISDGQFHIGQWQSALALKNINSNLLQEFAQNILYSTDFVHLKLYSLLLDLFAKGMVVDLSKFQFNTEEGPVALHAQINSALPSLFNLNVQANAEFPKQWLKRNLMSYYETKRSENPQSKINPELIAGQYVDHWLAYHLLIPKNSQQVTLDINYKEGHLLINGEPPELNNFFVNDGISHLK